MVCYSYLPHFQRDFQQKNVFGHDSGICVIMTKRLQRTARLSRGSAVLVPMETGLGYCPPLAGAPRLGSLLCLMRFLPQPSSNRPYASS